MRNKCDQHAPTPCRKDDQQRRGGASGIARTTGRHRAETDVELRGCTPRGQSPSTRWATTAHSSKQSMKTNRIFKTPIPQKPCTQANSKNEEEHTVDLKHEDERSEQALRHKQADNRWRSGHKQGRPARRKQQRGSRQTHQNTCWDVRSCGQRHAVATGCCCRSLQTM